MRPAGVLAAVVLLAATASAAPATTTTEGKIQILGGLAWGSPAVARFAPSKTGGAIAILEYAPKLMVRRVSFSSTVPAPIKDAVFAPANRTATLEDWVEDEQGNVFLLYKSKSASSYTTRLARVDANGAIAFDVEFSATGCAGLAPDGAGGVYTANYAPKLAPEFGYNKGRTRVARYGPQGAVLWEAIGAADVTYVGGACAVTRTSQGAAGAFALAATPNSLTSPGNVRLVRTSDAGAVLGQTDTISWPASGGNPAVTSLLLYAQEAYPLPDGGTAVLGRDPQSKSWLVRYDKGGAVTGGVQVQAPLQPRPDGTFVFVSNNTTLLSVTRYAPSGASFATTKTETSPITSEPAYAVKGVRWAGSRYVAWGEKTNGSSSYPMLAFVGPDGSRLGSFATGAAPKFDETVYGVAASGTHFLMLQKDASNVVRIVIGTYSLGGTAPQITTTSATLPKVRAGLTTP